MSRYRRKRSGGSGGSSGHGLGNFLGMGGLVFGTVALMICLIGFGIVLSSLDTAYTTAATYSEQVGLTDVMGIWPMVLFVIFMMVGLGMIGGGAFISYRKASGGNWMGIFMAIIGAVVAVVIGVIMFGTVNTQLHAVAVAINATTNVASFSGLVSIVSIWGMVIFIVIMMAAAGSLAGAIIGGYRRVKGGV